MTGKDLFYIGSAWGAGTGFIVKGYDFIITTVQTIGFSKNVIIKNEQIPKQTAKILFADYTSGLAFIEKPKNYSSNFDVLDFEMAVLEQTVTIYKTNYYNELIFSKSEIIQNKFQHNNISYFLLLNNNENTSGSIIINKKNELVGITKQVKSIDKNIALPSKYILKTMEEFASIGQQAIRCTNCQNIISYKKVIGNICPICSSEITKELLVDSLPAQTITDKEIEAALLNLKYNLTESRIGHHTWEITKGSANIIIRYDPDLKFIVSFSPICVLNNTNNNQIYEFLLSENKKITHFSFSINKNRVFLSTPYLIDDDFDEYIAKIIFEELIEKANYYNNIIQKMQ